MSGKSNTQKQGRKFNIENSLFHLHQIYTLLSKKPQRTNNSNINTVKLKCHCKMCLLVCRKKIQDILRTTENIVIEIMKAHTESNVTSFSMKELEESKEALFSMIELLAADKTFKSKYNIF